jgi:hypothetical protein
LKNFLPNYFASEALEVLLKILIRSKVLRKAAATEMAIVVKVINTAVNLWAKPDPGEDSCPSFHALLGFSFCLFAFFFDSPQAFRESRWSTAGIQSRLPGLF